MRSWILRAPPAVRCSGGCYVEVGFGFGKGTVFP